MLEFLAILLKRGVRCLTLWICDAKSEMFLLFGISNARFDSLKKDCSRFNITEPKVSTPKVYMKQKYQYYYYSLPMFVFMGEDLPSISRICNKATLIPYGLLCIDEAARALRYT